MSAMPVTRAASGHHRRLAFHLGLVGHHDRRHDGGDQPGNDEETGYRPYGALPTSTEDDQRHDDDGDVDQRADPPWPPPVVPHHAEHLAIVARIRGFA